MDAGKLDRRITIERLTEGALNTFNEPEESWSTYATRWASRQDLSDGERTVAGMELSEVVARFVVRSDSETRDISSEDRISGEGGTWNILGTPKEVMGDSFHWLEITARRRSD